MRMRKKCIGPLIAVASGLLMSACAASPEATREPAHPPMVIDNYRMPSPEALYAERYRTSAAQVAVDQTVRFVRCGEDCPGATPKTPVARVHTAVTRTLNNIQQSQRLANPPHAEVAARVEARLPEGEHSRPSGGAPPGQADPADEGSTN